MIEQFYSTKHVADILAVTTKAVERWRRKGKLKPVRAGKLCRYAESEINRFLGIGENGETFANDHVNEDGSATGELLAAQHEAEIREERPN
jgi:hypothetical protein